MKVAYLSVDPGIPVFGTKGASVHVQEIIRCWRARGAEVVVYATRVGTDVPADLADLDVVHVPVPAAPKQGDQDRRAVVAAREAAQAEAADEIARRAVADAPDAVYERYSLFSTALAQVVEATGAPGYLEVNAPLIDEQREHRDLVDGDRALQALSVQVAAATTVACVSHPVAEWVKTTVPGTVQTESVTVVPNGVNLERIRACADSALPDDDPGQSPLPVVFVGTLKPWHGVEDFLRAASLARRPWRPVVVGDGPERQNLQDLADRLGVQVEFTGALAPERIPGALAAAAAAVAPYPRTEQAADQYFSPLKIYEYCAAALPVVASSVGQIPSVLTEGQTGVLVPPSDPEALARALDALVDDPAGRRRLGRAARAMAERERSWERALDTITAGSPAGRPVGGNG